MKIRAKVFCSRRSGNGASARKEISQGYVLPLKLARVIGGDPIGKLLGQGKQWSDIPLSPQLRLSSLYGVSPMG